MSENLWEFLKMCSQRRLSVVFQIPEPRNKCPGFGFGWICEMFPKVFIKRVFLDFGPVGTDNGVFYPCFLIL